MLLAPLAAVLLLSAAPVSVEVGAKKTVTVPFPLAGGDNSNPKVVKAVVDTEHQRITFVGKAVGHSTYTAIDARAGSHVYQYSVTVVAPPPPSPSPSPSPSASPTASPSPSPSPAAAASGAGPKK